MSGLQFSITNAYSRRADATSWSTTNTAASTLETKGCAVLIVSGTPGTGVFLAPTDFADGQQLLLVNTTGQAVSIMLEYAPGTNVAWSQNNTTYITVASGAASNFVFYVDNSGNGFVIAA